MHARVIATLRSQNFFQAAPALQQLHGVFSRFIYLPSLSPHLWSIFFKNPRHTSVRQRMNCVPGGLWVIFHHIQCGNAGQMLSGWSYSLDTLISLICEETPGLSKHSHGFHQQIILQQEYVFLYFFILWRCWKKTFHDHRIKGWGWGGVKKNYYKQMTPPIFSFPCSLFHFQYLHLGVLMSLVSSEVAVPGKQLGKASFAVSIPIQLSVDMKTVAQDDRWPW